MSRYVHIQIDRQVSFDTESNRQTGRKTGRETVRQTGFKSMDGLPMAVAHSTTL